MGEKGLKGPKRDLLYVNSSQQKSLPIIERERERDSKLLVSYALFSTTKCVGQMKMNCPEKSSSITYMLVTPILYYKVWGSMKMENLEMSFCISPNHPLVSKVRPEMHCCL